MKLALKVLKKAEKDLRISARVWYRQRQPKIYTRITKEADELKADIELIQKTFK